MNKYKKEVELTYFNKRQKTTIDDIKDGEIIYLKVNSPLNYGIREWEYFGKLVKITKCYFYILEYCNAPNLGYWYSQEIKNKESTPNCYTKKWAKKSIREIWTVDTENKKEVMEFETNV